MADTYQLVVNTWQKKISNEISNGATILSDHPLSTKDYEYFKPYIRNVINSNRQSANILFICMLCEYAKREYNGTDFYQSFCNSMEAEQVGDNFFRSIIWNTFNKYNLPDFGCFSGERRQYVEWIKAHSIACFSKQKAFLDSTKKIHEWLGYNIQDRDFVEREIFYIQQKVKQVIALDSTDEDAEIAFDSHIKGQAPPRLSFAISTCRFFASVNTETLMRNYYPILQLIDNWYYPEDEPNVIYDNKKIEWIEKSFSEWKNDEIQEEERRANNQKSPYRNHKPFYKINTQISQETFDIIVPETTKEASTEDCFWHCKITSGPEILKDNHDLRIISELAFEEVHFWKTNRIVFSLPWEYLFKELTITIYESHNNQTDDDSEDNNIIAEWNLPLNNYKLFDTNGYQINKILIEKENILLIPIDANFKYNESVSNVRENSTPVFKKIQFRADTGAGLNINNDVFLSAAGQYYLQPFFPDEILGADFYHNGEKIQATKSHPLISLTCTKEEEHNFYVKINGRRDGIPQKRDRYILARDASNSNQIRITFSVAHFLSDDFPQDSIFTVEYGIRGVTNKSIKYILLKSFAFHFSTQMFKSKKRDLFVSREYQLIPNDSESFLVESKELKENSYWQRYSVTITPTCKKIEFDLKSIKNTIVSIPVRKAVYGFESSFTDARFFYPQNAIPFTDFRNILYIHISDIKDMSLRCNGISCHGIFDTQRDCFRFDLTSILNAFHNHIPQNLVLEYTDIKAQAIKLQVLSIKPWSNAWCIQNSSLYYQLGELPEGTTCYFDLFSQNQQLLKSIPLCICEKQKLLQIEKNRTYWYRRKICKPNIIPGLPDEVFWIDEKPVIIPPCLDQNNLANTTADIYDPQNIYAYRYSVEITNQKQNCYEGFLQRNNIREYAIELYDIQTNNDYMTGKIAMIYENNRYALGLDRNERKLVSQHRPPTSYRFRFDKTTFREG